MAGARTGATGLGLGYGARARVMPGARTGPGLWG